MSEAYIYDAVRTPRGKGRADGALHTTTSIDLSTQVLNAIVERNQFDTRELEDVIWGNVTPVGEQGGDIARSAILKSKIDQSVSGMQINRFCASGLEAVNLGSAQVRAGATAFISGGVEMMGRVPMGADGFAMLVDPSTACATNAIPQGISADLIATKFGFSRRDVDEYALMSQQRAKRSWDEGRFAKSIIPVRDINGRIILDRDEYLRPETTLETLGALNPAFEQIGLHMPGFDAVALLKYPELEKINHVHTAGNSSGIVDGSAAVLVGSKEFGEKYGLKPRARVKTIARVGSEPTMMLTGPVPATEKALAQAGMKASDLDIVEINEAFSAVVLRLAQAHKLDMDKVNPNGGAIALGHPLGATGAMLVGTALDELERSNKETALITLCVAAGMGIATIIERV